MTRTYADGIDDAARVAEAEEQRHRRNDIRVACHKVAAAIRTLSPSPSGIEVAREALTGWQPIETAPRIEDHAASFLVTNNLSARNAFGHMSHIWLSHGVHERDGQTCCFTDELREIYGLTHWMPLPAPPLCESASSKIGGDHG